MEFIPKIYAFILISSMILLFLIDFGYQRISADDNETSFEYAIKDGIQMSINKGDLRVNSEVTIDTERFKSSFEDLYESNQNIKDAINEKVYYNSSSNPPMVALESIRETESFIKGVIDENDDSIIRTSNKKIMIIEKND